MRLNRKKMLRRLIIFTCLLTLILAYVPAPVWAPVSIRSHDDPTCAGGQDDDFTSGDTVHSYGSGLQGSTDYDFVYIDPSSTEKWTNTKTTTSKGRVCDDTGYTFSCPGDEDGTWMIDVRLGVSSVGTDDFTLSGCAAPEFPAGLALLLAAVAGIYLLMRRKVGDIIEED